MCQGKNIALGDHYLAGRSEDDTWNRLLCVSLRLVTTRHEPLSNRIE